LQKFNATPLSEKAPKPGLRLAQTYYKMLAFQLPEFFLYKTLFLSSGEK
jgi:hypothetical protein